MSEEGGVPSTDGILSPAAQTVWKVLLLIAGISVSSIEVYRFIKPEQAEMGSVLSGLKSDNDAQNRTLAELAEKIKTVDSSNSKEHDKILEMLNTLSERQTSLRERIAVIESKLGVVHNPSNK